MRDDHQRAVHAAASARDEVECICDARVKCRPVFTVGWREVGSKRILRQLGIWHAAQIAEVALLQQRAFFDRNSGASCERSRCHTSAQQIAAYDVNKTVTEQAPRQLFRLTNATFVERHVGTLENA